MPVSRYDVAADMWTVETMVPVPRYHAGVTKVAGKMFLIGGFLEEELLDTRATRRTGRLRNRVKTLLTCLPVYRRVLTVSESECCRLLRLQHWAVERGDRVPGGPLGARLRLPQRARVQRRSAGAVTLSLTPALLKHCLLPSYLFMLPLSCMYDDIK